MDTLPVEIVDEIFEKIVWEKPKNLYRLRGVSKTWKSKIDQCTLRLSHVWCNKCTDKILEIYLDDMIQTRYPEFSSWQDYFSKNNIYPRPDIARNIYESRNDFPNLIHNEVRLTEICPPPECQDETTAHIISYDFNDDYLVINWALSDRITTLVRIYSTNDLNHHIREYRSITCSQVNFYSTKKQLFVVLAIHNVNNDYEDVFLVEFLVDNLLIPSHLPKVNSKSYRQYGFFYEITDNQCFTWMLLENWIQYYRWTPGGFEPAILIRVPKAGNGIPRSIKGLKINHSTLFVTAYKHVDPTRKIFYEYKIFRHSDNKLFFSDPKIYDRWEKLPNQNHDFRNLDLHSSNFLFLDYIVECHYRKLNLLARHFNLFHSINRCRIYPHHVILANIDTLIVFRGNPTELMDLVKRDDYCLRRFTIINLNINSSPYKITTIRSKNSCKFLLVFRDKLNIVDLIV